MENVQEPASYSPMSATTAAVELWESIDLMSRHRPVRAYQTRKLAEICYVINALASMVGCPGNMSVDDFRMQRETT